MIFSARILVLKRIFENIVEVGSEKVQANWEGPYVVTKADTHERTISRR